MPCAFVAVRRGSSSLAARMSIAHWILFADVRPASWGVWLSRTGNGDLRVGDGHDNYPRAWHVDAALDEALCATRCGPALNGPVRET